MEANTEEIEAESEHQDVPMEEDTVVTFGA
jgi:hypothetical protein